MIRSCVECPYNIERVCKQTGLYITSLFMDSVQPWCRLKVLTNDMKVQQMMKYEVENNDQHIL